MEYIYWLSQIQHSEQSLVGDKLYVLSQLLQHECSVLPGFVLGNNLLQQFLIDLDDFQSLVRELSDSSFNLDVNDYLGLQSVARRSRQIINRATLAPAWQTEIYRAASQLNSDNLVLQPFFFLPSGETLATQGFWRSHTCRSDPQALSQTIKKVWSELFTAKSLLYWHRLGLSGEKIRLAILVQPLQNASACGMVKITPDSINIEATWGLELSLLNGDVEVDKYCLDRHTGRVLSRYLGHKNYGYQVKDIAAQQSLTDCLEAYIPDEAHTQTYVLDRKAIATLFESTQKALQQQPEIKHLIWTAPELTSESDKQQFFITRFGDSLLTAIDSLSPQMNSVSLPTSDTVPLLTGIPAAPGKAIASVIIAKDFELEPQSIPANSILVIDSITINQIPLIKRVKGIITERGGKTSHAAIVARELKIPAIVNAVDATTILEQGSEILLDGESGEVYLATAAHQLSTPNLSSSKPSFSPQSIGTKLMVNISQSQTIENILELPVDGVGLIRSELMLADILANTSVQQWQSPSFQTEFTNRLTRSLSALTKAFAPRPVYYRSLDWTAGDVNNSILGNRGTYSYYLDSTLFSLELNALSAIAREGSNNLNLILPFVRSVEEFKFCYRKLENIGLTKHKSFQVWIMAEVPSVIWQLPEYINAGVQGIAIGTNDLTQLILGVDREQGEFSNYGLNANHPVVHKAIAFLITTARNHHIDCCICGQAPVDYPSLIEKLIGWGITSISVEPDAVISTHQAIARAERRILLDSIKS